MKKKFSITPIDKWFDNKGKRPLIIAGPCSAESFEQVYQTAKELSDIPQVTVFRAGVWKPRTNPDDYKGAGKKALSWLQQIKKDFNLYTAVEVLSPAHVEACLSHDIDILWLGARTVSNPYSVQLLAESLKGTNAIVLVKNPLNPDIKLWLGAIERINNSGIHNIAAVHRGFFPFESTKLRNIPKWELVIDLRTLHPEIPVICDPSHIAGNTKYISAIAQKAMDLCYDGLMIESHIHPSEALSDAQQQVTPATLKKIIHTLSYNYNVINDIEHLELLKLREQVDSIDSQLIELLSFRMNIVKQMAEYKQQHKIPILQLRRWHEIMTSRIKQAENLQLNTSFVKSLLEIIHLEALRILSDEHNKNL